MKVLFLHANSSDYLSAGLFHGLRSLLGDKCVDLPRFDCMYQTLTDDERNKIRGHGFTLYGLLPDQDILSEERASAWQNIHDYDFYIIADVWWQWDDYKRLSDLVDRERIIVVDPADTPRIFPWNNLIREHRYFRRSLGFLKRPARAYYKREYVDEREALGALPSISTKFRKWLLPRQVRPISFAIPEEKIMVDDHHERSQLFASNIVDKEVSKMVTGSFYTPLGRQQYKFDSEHDYYADIRRSRFGISTKRSGWDCLRHYEIAANGAVICFRDLDKKPAGCAPHGLNSANCIIYSNYADLMKQVSALSDEDYAQLKENSRYWVYQHTTTALAHRFLDSLV